MKKPDQFPKQWVRRVIRASAPFDRRDEWEGDLIENYRLKIEADGEKAANRWAAKEAALAAAWRLVTAVTYVLAVIDRLSVR